VSKLGISKKKKKESIFELDKKSILKFLKTFFLIFIISTFSFYCMIRIIHIHHCSGNAEWKENNNQKYLDVYSDNYYDLGYLTGQKISYKIITLKIILISMSSSLNTSYDKIKQQAKEYIPFILDEYILEMKGLADGASNKLGIDISFNDILIQNTFLDIVYGQLLPQQINPIGCTSIGVNGINNNPVAGQNFDFIKAFENTLSFVKHKLPGKPAIFGIKFGASLNIPMAINEYGVNALITVVQTNVIGEPNIPITCRTRNAFEKSSDIINFLEQFFPLDGLAQTNSFTLVLSDNNSVQSIDVVPGLLSIKNSNQLIRTNTFTDPSWQQFLTNTSYSKERQELVDLLVSNIISDTNNFTYQNLESILKNKPKVCRISDKSSDIATLAFMSRNKFGLGNPIEHTWGVIEF